MREIRSQPEPAALTQWRARAQDDVNFGYKLMPASALQFHGLTTQLPANLWLAIGEKAWRPKQEYPPLRVVYFSGKALTEGIETHIIQNVPVRVSQSRENHRRLFQISEQGGAGRSDGGITRRLAAAESDGGRPVAFCQGVPRGQCDASVPGVTGMSRETLKNLAASVNARLLAQARRSSSLPNCC